MIPPPSGVTFPTSAPRPLRLLLLLLRIRWVRLLATMASTPTLLLLASPQLSRPLLLLLLRGATVLPLLLWLLLSIRPLLLFILSPLLQLWLLLSKRPLPLLLSILPLLLL